MAHDSSTCKFCQDSEKIRSVIAGKDVEQLTLLVRELFNRLLCAEEDNSWYRGVLDGSWPTSMSILQRAVDKQKTEGVEKLLNEDRKENCGT